MKNRTGKECKKTNCINYKYYSNWGANLGGSQLKECMNCKNAFISQFKKEVSAPV